jgi:hypothetical protein
MAQTKVTDAMRNVTTVDGTKISGAVPSGALTNVDLSKLEYNQAILAFKVASANQLAKFSMVDQVIDEYQDATGIDAGASTNETAGGATTAKYYDGAVPASPSTVVKSYTGANQTFVVPSGVTTINFIAWGAAGGGGNTANGRGGGGGFIEGNVTVTAGETLNVKVGGGGINGGAASGPSYGGGGGGGTGIYRSSTVLAIAGAGGGGDNDYQGGAGGGTTGGQGNNNAGSTLSNGGTQSAGGAAVTGGGAGSLNQGGNVIDAAQNPDGTGGYNGGGKGDGDNASFTAGGGGGGYYGGSSGGCTNANHGTGAGGSSLTAGTNTQASTYQVANSGHANYAAGTGNGALNADGQHGHAVIKYTGVTISNLTLQSVATTAESAPTSADLVVLIEDNAGTATINTDIKAKVSRDGSAFSGYVTFVDEGDWGTNKRILVARNIDISGIATGTAMKYKLETLNQSAGSKETRIHATSLAWA